MGGQARRPGEWGPEGRVSHGLHCRQNPQRSTRPEAHVRGALSPWGEGGEQEPSGRGPPPPNHSGQVPCAPAKRLVRRAEERAAGTGGRETMRPREAQDSHVSLTQEGARRPRCRDRRPPSSAPPEPMPRRRARFCPVSCPADFVRGRSGWTARGPAPELTGSHERAQGRWDADTRAAPMSWDRKDTGQEDP